MPAADHLLLAVADLAIKAKPGRSGKSARVEIVAYGGGEIEPPGFGPTVIDLAGLTLPDSIPLLADHQNALDAIVGRGKPRIASGTVVVAGAVTSATEAGRTAIGLARDGIDLSASVGVEVHEREFLRPGQVVSYNGRTFTAGPRGLTIVRRGTLREVSLTPIGADKTAVATVSATKGTGPMPPETTATQPVDLVQAERDRVSRIEAACRDFKDHTGNIKPEVQRLQAAAIAGSISYEGLQAELLQILRDERPKGVGIRASRDHLPQAAVLEASLCLNAGLGESFVGDHFDERTMNAAMERPMRSTSIQSVFRAVCRAAGSPVDSFRTGDDIRAAFEADRMLRAASGGGGGFSTVSLPGILGNVANKAMLAAYNAVGAAWRSIAAVRSNVDFKAHTRYRMTGQGAFQKVGADGELKHFTVDEQGYQSQLDTYGSTIALTRQMIVNDDLSAFLGLPRIIGRQAGIAVDKAVFTLLLSNPSNFFSTGNKNYIEGATTPLGIASLTTLETLFLKQVDTNGDPVLIVPRTLLVPPELAAYAAQLVRSSETRDNEADKLYPTGNPHAGRFTPVSSPWLSTSSITGNSVVAWYLFGEPGDVAAIAVAFLNGRDMPIIESGDTSFDTLGVAWRGYFDFAVAMEDHRAAAKSKGAA